MLNKLLAHLLLLIRKLTVPNATVVSSPITELPPPPTPETPAPAPEPSEKVEAKPEPQIDPKNPPHFLVTRNEILMGRDREYPLTKEMEANLAVLLVRVNKLRQIWGKPLVVTSGYRPGYYNTRAGGAPNSAHTTCEAVDFLDKGQELSSWLVQNPDILRECGLFLENPKFTRTWAHLDIRPRTNRIFNP